MTIDDEGRGVLLPKREVSVGVCRPALSGSMGGRLPAGFDTGFISRFVGSVSESGFVSGCGSGVAGAAGEEGADRTVGFWCGTNDGETGRETGREGEDEVEDTDREVGAGGKSDCDDTGRGGRKEPSGVTARAEGETWTKLGLAIGLFVWEVLLIIECMDGDRVSAGEVAVLCGAGGIQFVARVSSPQETQSRFFSWQSSMKRGAMQRGGRHKHRHPTHIHPVSDILFEGTEDDIFLQAGQRRVTPSALRIVCLSKRDLSSGELNAVRSSITPRGVWSPDVICEPAGVIFGVVTLTCGP
mmetsp:Transcript_2650/g.4070  ORF Transcript_2650/g.4070 Transcript_2650/m.4070 type:complete len:299 (-) Transcript_2650:94-990(-)